MWTAPVASRLLSVLVIHATTCRPQPITGLPSPQPIKLQASPALQSQLAAGLPGLVNQQASPAQPISYRPPWLCSANQLQASAALLSQSAATMEPDVQRVQLGVPVLVVVLRVDILPSELAHQWSLINNSLHLSRLTKCFT